MEGKSQNPLWVFIIFYFRVIFMLPPSPPSAMRDIRVKLRYEFCTLRHKAPQSAPVLFRCVPYVSPRDITVEKCPRLCVQTCAACCRGWTWRRILCSRPFCESPMATNGRHLCLPTAAGEGPHALPQTAECADRPGLPQTQTGTTLTLSYSRTVSAHLCSHLVKGAID